MFARLPATREEPAKLDREITEGNATDTPLFFHILKFSSKILSIYRYPLSLVFLEKSTEGEGVFVALPWGKSRK